MLKEFYNKRGPKPSGQPRATGTNISMTPAMRARVVAEASQTGVSMAAVINKALEMYFERVEK